MKTERIIKTDKTNSALVIIISSIVCILPIILSVILYSDLPDRIAIQWGRDGQVSNYAPKALAAFGLPAFFLTINIISKLFLYNDPKRKNSPTVLRVFAAWVPPVLSVILVPITLFIAVGVNIPIALIASLIVGVVLIICGNYLPKSRQNYTIGIKLPWTLSDADNWNKTHRLAGYLYILAGLLVIAGAFVLRGNAYWLIIAVAAIVVIPVIYSYALYKRKTSN